MTNDQRSEFVQRELCLLKQVMNDRNQLGRGIRSAHPMVMPGLSASTHRHRHLVGAGFKG